MACGAVCQLRRRQQDTLARGDCTSAYSLRMLTQVDMGKCACYCFADHCCQMCIIIYAADALILVS